VTLRAPDVIKLLSARARELDDVLAALSYECDAEISDLKSHQKQLNEDKSRIQAEVSALKHLARLEDLRIFKVREKVGKNKFLFYWFAAWTINNKAHNAYLGSCVKMDAETAMQKARKLKAEALGLKLDDCCFSSVQCNLPFPAQ
jgi:hypothetical protein